MSATTSERVSKFWLSLKLKKETRKHQLQVRKGYAIDVLQNLLVELEQDLERGADT